MVRWSTDNNGRKVGYVRTSFQLFRTQWFGEEELKKTLPTRSLEKFPTIPNSMVRWSRRKTQRQRLVLIVVSNYSELNGSVKYDGNPGKGKYTVTGFPTIPNSMVRWSVGFDQLSLSNQVQIEVSNYSELNGSVKSRKRARVEDGCTTVSNYSELNGSVKPSTHYMDWMEVSEQFPTIPNSMVRWRRAIQRYKLLCKW